MYINEGSNIVVFGGRGFLGKYLINILAKKNARLIVVDRSNAVDKEFSMFCAVGQVSFVKVPKSDEEWGKLFEGSTHVINLIGAISSNAKEDLRFIHVELAQKIARFAKINKVQRLVHVSTLHYGSNSSEYISTKTAGETEVLSAFPNAIILRPSLMFCANDGVINSIIKMVKAFPIVPFLNLGSNKIYPVYVGDVGLAIQSICESPNKKVAGKILEIRGRKPYSIKGIVNIVASALNKKRFIIPVPYHLSLLLSCIMRIFIPWFISPNQIRLLKESAFQNTESLTNSFFKINKELDFAIEEYIKQ